MYKQQLHGEIENYKFMFSSLLLPVCNFLFSRSLLLFLNSHGVLSVPHKTNIEQELEPLLKQGNKGEIHKVSGLYLC